MAEDARRHDTGCPFCGLVCDDLTIENSGGELRVTAAGCWLSRERFGDLDGSASPMVDGRPVELSATIMRSVAILAGSRAPVFVAAADVAGMRAVLRLADRIGGVVDHPDSEALFRNLRVLQDAGALATTLSEVRNRADLVLILGPDPSPSFPRFFERCLEPSQTLFGDGTLRRAVVRLGPSTEGGAVPSNPAVDELPCTMRRLPEAIAALSALLRGGRSNSPEAIGLEHLGRLAERLKAARYGTIVWAPAMFDIAGAELIAQAALDLARHLNRTTRCSILPLGGSANLVGANQVCTWQTGYPIRTSLGSGMPEHDPYRFSATRMIREGEADALVWIAAFGGPALPLPADIPTVLLAPPAAPGARAAAAYMPVGTPGIDHAGQVFRTDGIVALRLAALRAAGLPDVASVIARIERRLVKPGAVN